MGTECKVASRQIRRERTKKGKRGCSVSVSRKGEHEIEGKVQKHGDEEKFGKQIEKQIIIIWSNNII